MPNQAVRMGSVAIIGAGIAGLSAARALAGSGVEVRLFDKGRSPGGRISTRREGNYDFDLGVQYLTASEDRFRTILEQWRASGVVQPWDTRLVLLERGNSIRVAQDVQRYVGVPGMSAVARSLAAGMDIHCQTSVRRASRTGDQWRIETEKGEKIDGFHWLILTTPPAQAIPLMTDTPALAEQIEAIRFQPVWTVMLAFDGPFYLPWDAAFVNQSPLAWIARNGAKPGRSAAETWVLHASGDWSAKNLELSQEQVCRDLTDAFFETTEASRRVPSFAKAHRWRYALTINPLRSGSLTDPGARMGLAGDWCAEGSFEGAYLSGLDLARRLLGSPLQL